MRPHAGAILRDLTTVPGLNFGAGQHLAEALGRKTHTSCEAIPFSGGSFLPDSSGLLRPPASQFEYLADNRSFGLSFHRTFRLPTELNDYSSEGLGSPPSISMTIESKPKPSEKNGAGSKDGTDIGRPHGPDVESPKNNGGGDAEEPQAESDKNNSRQPIRINIVDTSRSYYRPVFRLPQPRPEGATGSVQFSIELSGVAGLSVPSSPINTPFLSLGLVLGFDLEKGLFLQDRFSLLAGFGYAAALGIGINSGYAQDDTSSSAKRVEVSYGNLGFSGEFPENGGSIGASANRLRGARLMLGSASYGAAGMSWSETDYLKDPVESLMKLLDELTSKGAQPTIMTGPDR